MRHDIEFTKRHSSEQRVITTAERDDAEDQFFASEVFG
jgi:hypothetical protein